MSESGVVELLKIAGGHLPRARLEYDRINDELNSLKAELNNTVVVYQQFCDRNIELKKREDELQRNVDELEAKRTDLQKTTTESNRYLAEFQENNSDNDNLNLEMEQEIAMLMNKLSTPPLNIANSSHKDENEMLQYSFSP